MSDKSTTKPAAKSPDAEKTLESPKPTHFLARDGDKYTPLIPVDELPDFISVVGVPVYVSQEELLKAKGTGCFPAVTKASVPYTIAVEQEEVARPESVTSDGGGAMNVPSDAALKASSYFTLFESPLTMN